MPTNYSSYASFRKPSWAPAPWVFAPVWSVLYVLIFISFSYSAYASFQGVFPKLLLLPLGINLISNVIFTPLLFGMRNMIAATIDIFFVWGSLLWFILYVFPFAPWVAYLNIPYLLWVSFATVLQCTILYMNRKK